MSEPMISCRSSVQRVWKAGVAFRSLTAGSATSLLPRRLSSGRCRSVDDRRSGTIGSTTHGSTVSFDIAAAAVLLTSIIGLDYMNANIVNAEVVSSTPQYDLAENQEFWSNVVRYGRYFVTVMLGTGYVMLRPLRSMMDRPTTALLAVAGVVGLFIFVKFTLDAMLGLSDL